MKKMYVKPAQRVIDVRTTNIICQSVRGVSGSSGMKFGGAGNGPARSNGRGSWDEEDW